MAGQILCTEQGAVAQVTLSHTGKFNAMSRSMWRDLKTLFDGLAVRSDLRCIVIRGEDGHFCAGGDIAEYPSFRFDEAGLTHFHEVEVWGGLNAILSCDIPVIEIDLEKLRALKKRMEEENNKQKTIFR